MAALYEINNELLKLYGEYEASIDPETGEISDQSEELLAKIEAQEMDRTEKIENIGCFIKNLKSDAEQLKEEAKKLTERAKAAAGKAERLENYLKRELDGQKFSTAKVVISWRKSESVECSIAPSDYMFTIPEDYLRFKDPEIDKTAVKKALKAGLQIPGCSLKESRSMTIK